MHQRASHDRFAHVQAAHARLHSASFLAQACQRRCYFAGCTCVHQCASHAHIAYMLAAHACLDRFASGAVSEEEIKERQARSLQDPEVRAGANAIVGGNKGGKKEVRV
eukprot:1156229-Pelagomonas_calceolata.AAC.3